MAASEEMSNKMKLCNMSDIITKNQFINLTRFVNQNGSDRFLLLIKIVLLVSLIKYTLSIQTKYKQSYCSKIKKGILSKIIFISVRFLLHK